MIAGSFLLFGCGGVALLAYLLCGRRRERKRADVMRKHLIQLSHVHLR
jgi:hypothetical protein